jgi:hypothetical protein
MTPEFSQRELETIEPIYQRALNEKTFRQQNAIVVGSLRNECDRKGISIIDFLRFKTLQTEQPEKNAPEGETDPKRCLFCGEILTGKKQFWCNDSHRVNFNNLKNKENK